MVSRGRAVSLAADNPACNAGPDFPCVPAPSRTIKISDQRHLAQFDQIGADAKIAVILGTSAAANQPVLGALQTLVGADNA